MRIIDFSKSLLLVLFLGSDKWQSRAFPFHERETEHWLKEEWPHSLLHHNSSTSQQWEQHNMSLHSDCFPCQTHSGIFLMVFHCQSRNLILHISKQWGRARGIRKMKLKLFLRFWERHMRGSSVLLCLSQDRKALSSTTSAGCTRWTQTVNSCCVCNKPWNSSNKTVCWNDNVSFHSHILLQLWSNY